MKCKTCGQEILTPTIQIIEAKTLEWGKTCEKELNWEDAKQWCEEQGEGWRLPTIIELLEAYHGGINGFGTSYYWSATENSTASAVGVNFSNGGTCNVSKSRFLSVRCVR